MNFFNKNYFILLISVLFLTCANDNFFGTIVNNIIKKEITSPDNSLTLKVKSKNGKILYSLIKNNKLIIKESALGIVSDEFDSRLNKRR